MVRRKIPFFDVVLMLIRDKPGHTRREIAEEAASWGLVWSLLPEKPSAALSLLRQRGDRTKGLDREAEECANSACGSGFADEDADGKFRITASGQEWLRTNSGL
jgi:hypothetical protein